MYNQEKSELKKKASEYEKSFRFREALEIYKQNEDMLGISDGSILRYAKLLYEFQEFGKAKNISERIVFKHKYITQSILEILADIYENLGENEKALTIYI